MNTRYTSSSTPIRLVCGFLACVVSATLLIGVAVGLTGEDAATLLARSGDGNGGIARVVVRAT